MHALPNHIVLAQVQASRVQQVSHPPALVWLERVFDVVVILLLLVVATWR